MRFVILGSRIVVKPRKAVFSNILAKPETAREDYAEDGIIVQVGPEAPPHLEVGMHVAFHPGVGERLRMTGDDHLVINPGDLRASLDEELHDGAAG